MAVGVAVVISLPADVILVTPLAFNKSPVPP
jgi:hypothetical protein